MMFSAYRRSFIPTGGEAATARSGQEAVVIEFGWRRLSSPTSELVRAFVRRRRRRLVSHFLRLLLMQGRRLFVRL